MLTMWVVLRPSSPLFLVHLFIAILMLSLFLLFLETMLTTYLMRRPSQQLASTAMPVQPPRLPWILPSPSLTLPLFRVNGFTL